MRRARALAIAWTAAAQLNERAGPRWADIARRLYIPTGGAVEHHSSSIPSTPVDPDFTPSRLLLLTYPSLDMPMSAQAAPDDYRSALPPDALAARNRQQHGARAQLHFGATAGDPIAAPAGFSAISAAARSRRHSTSVPRLDQQYPATSSRPREAMSRT